MLYTKLVTSWFSYIVIDLGGKSILSRIFLFLTSSEGLVYMHPLFLSFIAPQRRKWEALVGVKVMIVMELVTMDVFGHRYIIHSEKKCGFVYFKFSECSINILLNDKYKINKRCCILTNRLKR